MQDPPGIGHIQGHLLRQLQWLHLLESQDLVRLRVVGMESRHITDNTQQLKEYNKSTILTNDTTSTGQGKGALSLLEK